MANTALPMHHWLEQIKRLHALAETGLAFSPQEFDRERFEEMADIAKQMLADLADTQVAVINDLVTPYHRRYVTPQVEVRGAVIRHGQVLLVQEKSDLKWTLPGGYADVGLTAVENIRKEISEEASLDVNACQLVSVRRKASGDYDPDIREFYKLIFLCHEQTPQKPAKAGMETCGAGFFNPAEMPPLSSGRTIMRDIVDVLDFAAGKHPHTIVE